MSARKRSTINLNPLDDIKNADQSYKSTAALDDKNLLVGKKSAKLTTKKSKYKIDLSKAGTAEEVFEEAAPSRIEAAASRIIMGERNLIDVEVSGESAEEIFNQSNSALLGDGTNQSFFKRRKKVQPNKIITSDEVVIIEEVSGGSSQNLVCKYAEWSIVAGLVPANFLDTVAVTGVQLKMISELCKLYGVPFKKESARAIISSLIASNITTGLSHTVGLQAIKSIPYLGKLLYVAVQPAMSYATTFALGSVFVSHFEKKGSLVDFDIHDVGVSFKDTYESAKKAFKTDNFTRRFIDPR